MSFGTNKQSKNIGSVEKPAVSAQLILKAELAKKQQTVVDAEKWIALAWVILTLALSLVLFQNYEDHGNFRGLFCPKN